VRHDCAWVGQPPRLPQRIVEPEPIGRDVAAHGQVVPQSGPRGSKSRGAGYLRLAAQPPPARLIVKPARLETAGDAPRGWTSRSMTSKPDKESRDYDGSMLTSERDRTRRSPMLTHGTSPVSGASVVGMTSGVCQGQRCLPAGIPGISTALSQEDRLWPKGRLRQQPAGDSTEESQSRAKTTRPF
jgi:hypothetical protein